MTVQTSFQLFSNEGIPVVLYSEVDPTIYLLLVFTTAEKGKFYVKKEPGETPFKHIMS